MQFRFVKKGTIRTRQRSQEEQTRSVLGRTVGTNNRHSSLDKYDVAILSALASNTRLTTVELAAMVHLSRTAVSRRIVALRKTQVLSDAADVLNYASLGFDVRARVEVNVASRAAETLRQQLLRQPEVLTVAVVAGNGQLCLDVIAIDMEHLHSFIQSLQRNGETTTKIVYAAHKSELSLLERMRLLGERKISGLVRA